MSAKPLLDQLHRDALEERERRLANARAQALRLSEAAEHLLQRERRDALAERERALRAELDHARAVVSRQCQLEQLHARRRLVDRCLKAAFDRTATLCESPGFIAALQRQVARALSYLPDGAHRARCSRVIEGDIRQALANHGAANTEMTVDDGADFGFVLESHDGSVMINATLATLIATERDDLAISLVKRYQGQAP
jgi:vacuolar-type H+-ATPase subunit E/Vma4